MIGKVPRPGRGFRGIVSYLLHGPRRGSAQSDRVAWTTTRNLLLDDPERAPKLMRMTASKSVRVVRPVYHFVISWSIDEAPTPDLMRAVADATCRDLGLDEHQRLYIAHNDTENPHVHIVVNRVHPDVGIAWQTSHDYRRIEQSLARQARELGLQVVPGRHNGLAQQRSQERRPRDGTYQRDRRLSRPTMAPERIAALRPALLDAVAKSQSWDELGQRLAAIGLRLERKGQGLVIKDPDGDIKLSEVQRGLSTASLLKTFGPIVADMPRARGRPKSRTKSRRRRQQDR